MSKKFFLLFLVVAFTALVTAQAWADTAYKLRGKDGAEVELVEETSSDGEEGVSSIYVGGNFYGRYNLPELELVSYDTEAGENTDEYPISANFKVSWKISQTGDALVVQTVSKDSDGDFMILSGLLPASSTDVAYEEGDNDGEYIYGLSFDVAITEIEEAEYKAAVGAKADFNNGTEIIAEEYGTMNAEDEIEPYTSAPETLIKEIISKDIESLEDLKEVTSGYSVTINAHKDAIKYNYYIDDGRNAPIDIPGWLEYKVTSTDENFNSEEEEEEPAPITSITISFPENSKGLFKDGSKGVIRIPFMDTETDPAFLLEWPVVLSKPFTIANSSKALTFDLTVGQGSVKKTAEYTGATPVSFEQTGTVTGVTFTVDSDDKTITVIAEAGENATAITGTNVTFTFKDANGKTDTITATVNVTVPVKPSISVNGTTTLSVTAGESVSTTLTAQGVGGATISKIFWDIGSVPAGLTATITASTDKSATFLISADETAAAGSKNVSIKAIDTADSTLSTTVNLVVTVKTVSKSAEDMTDSIIIKDSSGADSPKPFSKVKHGEKATFTITLPTSIVAKIWTVLINGVASHTVTVSSVTPAADNWVTVTNYSATGATVEAEVPASLNTDSAISVLVTDTNGKEYTADLGTVSKTSDGLSSSGSGCDAGLGALTLALAASLFISKKH